MCISPLHKRNPYYGANPLAHMSHDCEHQYLNIPCGHCSECLAVKQSAYIQRVQMESEYNHLFFATLTYDNKHLPVLTLDVPVDQALSESGQTSPDSFQDIYSLGSLFNEDGSLCEDALPELSRDAESRIASFLADESLPSDQLPELLEEPLECQCSTTSIEIAYADVRHLQLMFKRMRDNNTLGRPFRYLAVSERGSRRGRPHFHILFFVPKHKGDDVATCNSLNQALSDMLLRFWSTNIGTRKNPIYERNFTYRERWIGRKLYRNFDCHYVNPVLTTEGVADVAFYVTKYIFKDSDKENSLKQLVFCKTSDLTEFHAVWDIVKSRCVCSKGLGLDAVFYTDDVVERHRKPLYEQAHEMMLQVGIQEDLPANDFELAPVSSFFEVVKKKRLMVPNFDLVQKLKDNALLEKEKGHAIFVRYNGEHIPLAAYYRKRVLDAYQLTDLYFSWDPIKYPDKHNRADVLPAHALEKESVRLERIRAQIDEHEVLDSNSFDIEKGRSIDPYDSYRSLSKYLNLDGKVRPKILLGK